LSENPRSWKKPVAWGCGLLVLLPMLGVFVIGARTCAPLGAAREAQTELEQQFGPAGSFTPEPDGAIPADRVQVFIKVRDSLSDTCNDFATMLAPMDRLAELDGNDPSIEEITAATGGLAKTAVGITPRLGEFYAARNQALLDQGMGLGEYVYIYALAYQQQLLDSRHLDSVFAEGRAIPPETAAVLLKILQNHGRVLNGTVLERERALLDAELAAMQSDPKRLLWQDQVPESMAGSLAAYRAELDAGFCRATSGVATDLSSLRAIMLALD